MISYWKESIENENKNAKEQNFQKTLQEKLKCDICIVGAGITGITTRILACKRGF